MKVEQITVPVKSYAEATVLADISHIEALRLFNQRFDAMLRAFIVEDVVKEYGPISFQETVDKCLTNLFEEVASVVGPQAIENARANYQRNHQYEVMANLKGAFEEAKEMDMEPELMADKMSEQTAKNIIEFQTSGLKLFCAANGYTMTTATNDPELGADMLANQLIFNGPKTQA